MSILRRGVGEDAIERIPDKRKQPHAYLYQNSVEEDKSHDPQTTKPAGSEAGGGAKGELVVVIVVVVVDCFFCLASTAEKRSSYQGSSSSSEDDEDDDDEEDEEEEEEEKTGRRKRPSPDDADIAVPQYEPKTLPTVCTLHSTPPLSRTPTPIHIPQRRSLFLI